MTESKLAEAVGIIEAQVAWLGRYDVPGSPNVVVVKLGEALQLLAAFRAQQEPAERDAARWRAIQHVFHITDTVGARTGSYAVKLSTYWAAWVDGDHASVTDAVDAYAARAAEKEQKHG